MKRLWAWLHRRCWQRLPDGSFFLPDPVTYWIKPTKIDGAGFRWIIPAGARIVDVRVSIEHDGAAHNEAMADYVWRRR